MSKPSQPGPDDAGGAEHRAEEPLVLAPLRGGKRSATTVNAVEKMPALPEALQGPEHDQLGHAPRLPGEHRAEEEHAHRR